MQRPVGGPEILPADGAGFIGTYFVVATSAEQALEFCRRFEPVDVRATLRLSDAKDLGPAEDDRVGVEHVRRGYAFYSGE